MFLRHEGVPYIPISNILAAFFIQYKHFFIPPPMTFISMNKKVFFSKKRSVCYVRHEGLIFLFSILHNNCQIRLCSS